MSAKRPSVSVIIPFLGDAAEARAAVSALARLRLAEGDELLVADNTPDQIVAGVAPDGVRRLSVVRADLERSAFYARNVAAERARGEWLLFVDADCRLPEPLVDDYFAAGAPARDVGAVAGRIDPAPQGSFAARWAASRRVLDQESALELAGGPAAATANLLVRRNAWAAVGGFFEGVVSGADHDFCWRLRDAGWRLEYRPEAAVEHVHRETVREVLAQFAGYAAGDAWLNRRRPGAVPPRRSGRAFARGVAGAVGYALTGRLERARMKALDSAVAIAQALGARLGNAVARPPLAADADRRPRLVVAADRFPPLTAQFIRRDAEALRAAGWGVRIEAVERPARPLLGGGRGIRIDYIEDEGAFDRVRALASIASRHPLRVAGDLIERRRYEPADRMPLRALAPAALRLGIGGERHVHVHFAALAAANALRAARVPAVPVSVTPHSQEIYLEPVSLSHKLERAAFATTVCAYNVRHLRALVAPAAAERIHELPIGIRASQLRRRHAYPGGRTVVAVGRLIEMKGFRYLIEAAALLEREAPLERIRIAGDGELRGELERLVGERGVAHRVELLGSLEPEAVRDVMESADVFAVPSVVAADGNRDALPVVVYEAMAMEVPVVASDEVGLPEVVRPAWGRLAAPGDAGDLARAIREVLSLPVERRREMGEAAREFVVAERDLDRQAARLIALIEGARR